MTNNSEDAEIMVPGVTLQPQSRQIFAVMAICYDVYFVFLQFEFR